MKLIKRDPNIGYLDNWLWVPRQYVNVEGTKRALTHMFVDQYNVRELRLYRETAHHILVPRALWPVDTLPYQVVDCRPTSYRYVEFKSRIKLDHLPDASGRLQPTGDTVQRAAHSTLTREMGGILQLACGKGKTVVLLELAATMKVPTLVIVDNTTLLEQWEKQVNALLHVPGGLGYVQADRFEWKKGLVLATYQTIANRAEDLPEEVKRWFGLIAWDEGHHISAPTFAKSADLFYGKRVALTATPIRADGTHVVYEFHIGRVIYKDLSQKITPNVYFKWTGLELDETDPTAKVRDRNKDIHLSMLNGYLGRHRQRLQLIIDDVNAAKAAGRSRILVLSNSIQEVVNLLTLYTRGPQASLYSDIPVPTNLEIGETLTPVTLHVVERKKRERTVEQLRKHLSGGTLNPIKAANYQQKLAELEQVLAQCAVQDKIDSALEKRQREFLAQLRTELTDGGLMIYDVPSKDRIAYARNCRVVFAIMKYGKEGLDAPDLDTVLVSTPFSQRNGLQQLMGRTTRDTPGKMKPAVVFYEDNIGPIIGMCKKLRQHLTEWPHEEGGPYHYRLAGHPKVSNKWNVTNLFG